MAVAMDEECRQDHEGEQLQKLRLPVLEGCLTPPPEIAALAECLCGLAMRLLIRHEVLPAHPGLQAEAHQEQGGERDAETIVSPKVADVHISFLFAMDHDIADPPRVI